MHKTLFILTLLCAVGFVVVAKTHACGDCPSKIEIGLKDSIAKADLIIVGSRVDQNTSEYPETIDLKIKKIIKGIEPRSVIRAKSYTAECEYGLIVTKKNQDFIFLLQRSGLGYTAINRNCGVSTLSLPSTLKSSNDLSLDMLKNLANIPNIPK